MQALSLLQKNMTPEDFVKYQVLVAPKPKPKSLKRLHKGQIDKLELDLQRHRDMLQGVLSRIRVESEECEELRAQVAREQAPSDNGEAIPPTQCDSQQENDMISRTSTGAEDDLDVSRDNGVWECRRNAIIKSKRMVKLKDKDKVKVKLRKTIIIEEEPPPAPPASGKQLADVIARLSPGEIARVIGHLPSSTVHNWVQSIGAQQTVVQSSGAQSSEFCG